MSAKHISKEIKGRNVRADLERIDTLARYMDSHFQIPGTSIRFGFDALLGLIPGIGDSIALLISGYILRLAHTYEAPLMTRAAMVWNIFIDWLIGLIPLLGDIFDVSYKANLKNAALLRKHMESTDMLV
ncbi:MAG: DUF4112 domain-containing protein [Pseudobdellovibrionaceae bacterium]